MLFRGTPQAKLAPGINVQLHPVLQGGSNFIGENFKHFSIYSDRRHKSWKICQLMCARQLATSPPLTTVELGGNGSGNIKACFDGGFFVRNTGGVTVLDMLKGIAVGWGKLCWFQDRARGMTFYEGLSRDHYWAGWAEPKAQGGLVLLRPKSFRSTSFSCPSRGGTSSC